MKMNNKAKRVSSPLIKKIFAEASPIKTVQNKNRVELACKIYDLIKLKGYGCSEFANKMNRHPSEISKWVSGSHNFTIDTLGEIAFNLDVPLSDLFQQQTQKTVYHKKVIVVQHSKELGSNLATRKNYTGDSSTYFVEGQIMKFKLNSVPN